MEKDQQITTPDDYLFVGEERFFQDPEEEDPIQYAYERALDYLNEYAPEELSPNIGFGYMSFANGSRGHAIWFIRRIHYTGQERYSPLSRFKALIRKLPGQCRHNFARARNRDKRLAAPTHRK